jgi:molybdopterin/thiamine biosynthesis adenylyltransferase
MSDRFVRQADLVPQQGLSEEQVTVIGVGAIGRNVALQLASIGLRRMTLIDFDRVDETNTTTQGYRHRELGVPKVVASRQMALEIDPTMEVFVIEDRFRTKYPVSRSVFCCVDSITDRQTIWRQVGHQARFWCDGRMLGEVIRVLTVADFFGRESYSHSFFSKADVEQGRCTSRSTIYTAGIAAGLMVHQFCRWLRGIRPDGDVLLNLLAGEMTVADESTRTRADSR